MYVRWKRIQDPEWVFRVYGHGYSRKTYAAYLVIAVRVDGKPRQRQYYLAGYSDYDPEHLPYQTELAKDIPERRRRFWEHVYMRLYKLQLDGVKISTAEQERIVQKLAERVPRPVVPTY